MHPPQLSGRPPRSTEFHWAASLRQHQQERHRVPSCATCESPRVRHCATTSVVASDMGSSQRRGHMHRPLLPTAAAAATSRIARGGGGRRPRCTTPGDGQRAPAPAWWPPPVQMAAARVAAMVAAMRENRREKGRNVDVRTAERPGEPIKLSRYKGSQHDRLTPQAPAGNLLSLSHTDRYRCRGTQPALLGSSSEGPAGQPRPRTAQAGSATAAAPHGRRRTALAAAPQHASLSVQSAA